MPQSERVDLEHPGNWLCDAAPVSGLRDVWGALRNLRGWPLALLVFCAAQVRFQVRKALRGEMGSVDVALLALFLAAVVLVVSRAVRQERTRSRDLPGRHMESP